MEQFGVKHNFEYESTYLYNRSAGLTIDAGWNVPATIITNCRFQNNTAPLGAQLMILLKRSQSTSEQMFLFRF